MKIREIRDTIEQLNFSRNWVTGGTHHEFLRQNIPQALTDRIAEVRALQIAPRFALDIQRRDEAVERAVSTIARWHRQRADEGVPA